MPLLAADPARGDALSDLVTQFQQNGGRIDAHQPGGGGGKQAAGALAVVRIRTPWTLGRKTDDAGASATALGERLQQGDDDADKPLTNADYQLAITSATATTVVVSDDAEDLLHAGASVALTGTSRNGWYTVQSVSTASGSTTITVNEPLPTNAGGGILVIPRSVGRVGTSNLVTVVTRSRHDVTVCINAGGEYVLLSRPRCWVILDEDLGPATIVTSGADRFIRPSKARATVLIESDAAGEADDLALTEEKLTLCNYDESLTMLRDSTCEVELSGLNWIPISPSCNVSLLRTS